MINKGMITFRVIVIVSCLFIVSFSGPTAKDVLAAGKVIYVSENGKGLKDGTSWSHAYNDLQKALQEAVGGDEIYLTAGTYFPITVINPTGEDRKKSFRMKNGVKIYGSFPSNSNSRTTIEERNTVIHPTILSGDIGIKRNSSDNSYHVVENININATALLDGVEIKSGMADGHQTTLYAYGGGMYNKNSHPILNDVHFFDNTARASGGAILNDNSNPSITFSEMDGNYAGSDGGAMTNISNSNPTLVNVAINNNIAFRNGGGIYNENSSPTLNRARFMGNSANIHGGAIYNNNSHIKPLINTVIVGNEAKIGGGMYNFDSSPTLTNMTIGGNKAESGGGIYNTGQNAKPIIRNTIIWGNNSNVMNTNGSILKITYSLIEGSNGSGSSWNPNVGLDEHGNIDVDPSFRSPINDDYNLKAESLAINSGNNLHIPRGITTDLNDLSRIVDTIVDLGAYEFQNVTKMFIKEIQPIPSIEVAIGTEKEKIPLPNSVNVMLGDDMLSAVRVQWDDGTPKYNKSEIGTYEFKGTLILTEGISNSMNLTAKLNVIVKQGPINPLINFTDIEGHWAKDDIIKAVNQSLIEGYPDQTFRPNKPITRAEFTVIAARALDLKAHGAILPFTDEDKIGKWAKFEVAQALHAGLIEGYEDGSFRPNAKINRSEIAVMIARALEIKAKENIQTNFADNNEIPNWAKYAVAELNDKKIIEGRGSNQFVPKANATRAESVVMLLRMLEEI